MEKLGGIETPENETRAGVAKHKPCSGCGRSWDECGGGWLEFGADGLLEARWRCNRCVPPVEHREGAAGFLADLLDLRAGDFPLTVYNSGGRDVTIHEAIGILSVGLWLKPGGGCFSAAW